VKKALVKDLHTLLDGREQVFKKLDEATAAEIQMMQSVYQRFRRLTRLSPTIRK
jgi:hypothetical protein